MSTAIAPVQETFSYCRKDLWTIEDALMYAKVDLRTCSLEDVLKAGNGELHVLLPPVDVRGILLRRFPYAFHDPVECHMRAFPRMIAMKKAHTGDASDLEAIYRKRATYKFCNLEELTPITIQAMIDEAWLWTDWEAIERLEAWSCSLN